MVLRFALNICHAASNGEREVNLTGSRDVIVKQSSALPGWRLRLVADKAVDGRYSDSNFLGEDGKEYGGSCTITSKLDVFCLSTLGDQGLE